MPGPGRPFEKGHKGGPGRPPKARETAYLELFTARCSLEDAGQIIDRAVADAKKGDARAREWIFEHIVGPPGSVGIGASEEDGGFELRLVRREPTVTDASG